MMKKTGEQPLFRGEDNTVHEGASHHRARRERLEKDFAEGFGRMLREELEAAGHPTYQAIANRGGISKSAVSDAMRGVRLPSARTVWGIMAGLGRPAEAIVIERDRLARELLQSTTTSPSPAALPTAGLEEAQQPLVPGEQGTMPDGSPSEPPVADTSMLHAGVSNMARNRASFTGFRSRKFLAACAGIFVVGLAVGALASWFVLVSATPTTAKSTVPESGAGVVDSGCMRDGVLMAEAVRGPQMRLELWLSSDCHAVWGVVRRDAQLDQGSLEVAVYPQADPQAEISQRHSVDDASTAYTNIMVIPDHRLKSVCVTASAGDAGGADENVKPLCVSLG